MPELPEVETVVRSLEPRIIGRNILDIRNWWPKHLPTHSVDEFRERVVGSAIDFISRRGKYLVFTLDNADSIIIHLKMTGQLLLQPSSESRPDHVHTIFSLSGGDDLRFRDVRKFGRVYLTDDPSSVLGKLGPEPLSKSFTYEVLCEMLHSRRRILKPLLLDQRFIAGIGTIYADEALHGARIAPNRISSSLSQTECRDLHASIQHTLNSAIGRGGASISDYRRPDGSEGGMQETLRVYGREGEPCPRCEGSVIRTILGGRSTYYCDSCQV